jgi:DNA replication and repair protein RecF
VRHGAEAAVARVEGLRGPVPLTAEARLSLHHPKRLVLDGAPLSSTDELRSRIHALVFTPDRLAVVKGGPAARRAYFDRTLSRLLPSRAQAPIEYGRALGQRNACLRRVAAGVSGRDALQPWSDAVAHHGALLAGAREETLRLLAPAFRERAGELGLGDATLVLVSEPATVEALGARLDRDLERGSTGVGPHLDEIRLLAGDRDLRTFGSYTDVPPLLLLDDALSELDGDRRRILSARLGAHGQAIVTATGAEALPLAPAQLLAVSPGEVRST